MQLVYVIILLVLNSGIVRYDSFFFGLIEFSYTVHILLNSVFICLLVYESETDRESNSAVKKGLLAIALYLFFRFCYDFYSVGSAYKDYAIPTMLSQVLSYVIIYVVYRMLIPDFEIFIRKLQNILFILGLLSIIFYLSNISEAKNEILWREGAEFIRYKHGFYHLSMLSLYISCIQLFVIKNKYNIAFVIMNIAVQLISISLTNYRSSMIISFGFVLTVLLMYLVMEKKYKYLLVVAIIAAVSAFISFDYDDSSGIFARIFLTESLMEDPNMIWRMLESKMALDQMDTIKDYLIGVGYIKPFYLDEYKIFFLHNGYVSIFYNYGILAVFLYGFLIYNFIRSVFRNNIFRQMQGIVTLIYLAGLLMQNFTSGIFTREESAVIGFGLFLMIFDRSSRVKGDVCQTQADQ